MNYVTWFKIWGVCSLVILIWAYGLLAGLDSYSAERFPAVVTAYVILTFHTIYKVDTKK
jgi:hypothetical protein